MKVRRNPTKWSERAAAAQSAFAEGVSDPRGDWQKETIAATERYKAGVAKAVERGAFEKGVSASGTARWQQKTLAKGPGRFAEGVREATEDYGSAVTPYLDVIERTTLPPRYPAGDPRNIERSKVIAAALHAAKLARTSR